MSASERGAASDAGASGAATGRAAHKVAAEMDGLRAFACAILVCGGSGTRFGNPGGKQLVDIAGRPMMSWSIGAFDRSELVGHIVVVCPSDKRDEMRRRAVEPFAFQTPITFADAGATRQDSTRAGLEAVPAGFSCVAVHDGARPLITVEAIDRAIRALAEDEALDGVVCGQPAIDTLKRADADGIILDTPPRTEFWTVQTPQVFRTERLRRACTAADATGFVGTDDASLVERAGGRVRCIASPRDNLKVTVPEDLGLVDALMRVRLRNEGSAVGVPPTT